MVEISGDSTLFVLLDTHTYIYVCVCMYVCMYVCVCVCLSLVHHDNALFIIVYMSLLCYLRPCTLSTIFSFPTNFPKLPPICM